MAIYFLIISSIDIYLLRLLASKENLTPERLMVVPIFSLMLFFIWKFDIKLNLYAANLIASFELIGWPTLAILLISGPTIAILSLTLGDVLFQFSEKKPFSDNPTRARTGSIVANIFAWALPINFVLSRTSLLLTKPPHLLLILGAILLLQAACYIIVASIYVAILDKKNILKILPEWLSFKNNFVYLTTSAVFPGLAYMAAVLWKAHFYLLEITLLIPFFLVKRAMESAFEAAKEIVNTIEAIVTVIEAKDPYTQKHCNRVALYAMVIGRFCGLSTVFVERIGNAARLHDVGKILIADRVLKKDGSLTNEEYGHIKLHADPNKILMNQIPDGIPLKQLIELGRHHHERFDGKGYPDQLAGEAIPIEVRIIAMADAWDAMTTKRVYRDALPEEKVLSEIQKYKEKQWDPLVVEAFLEAHQQKAIEEVNKNPNVLNNPQSTWQIKPKLLKYTPPPSATKKPLIEFFFSHLKSILLTSIVSLICAFLYVSQISPIHGDAIVLYVALAILLEFFEIKFPKSPRFSPAESVYLALLFILPPGQVLMLILFAGLIRALYFFKIEPLNVFQILRRWILFSLSVPFFTWLGYGNGSRIFVPRDSFENFLQPVLFLGIFFAWSILHSILKFFLAHLETIIRRGNHRVHLHWPTLKYSMFSDAWLAVPFALLLLSFHAVNGVHFPFLVLSFVLVLVFSYPLLNYYRRVVEGNPKTLEALADTADQKFPFYKGHSKRVADLSGKLATSIGVSDEDLEDLQRAARLLGLGNVGIPDQLLNKPEKLTDEEMKIMRQHVEITANIAKQYSFYKEEVGIILNHHEWWDGGGYPWGIKGETIGLGGRILAVADCFSAMTSERPYRNAMSTEQAILEIKANAGKQFDPEVVEAFLDVMESSRRV